MPQRYIERIMRLIRRNDYTPLKCRALSHLLHVPEDHYDLFRQAVKLLAEQERIAPDYKKGIRLPDMPQRITGTYRANPKGFGFVVPDQAYRQGDLYIPFGQALDAVTGDRVAALPTKLKSGGSAGRMTGRIVKIIERGDHEIVGLLRQSGRQWFVRPEGDSIHTEILVDDPSAKDAKAGDKVVVEITRFPSLDIPGKGVILERLGQGGKSQTELKAVIRIYKLADKFPRAVLNEARTISREFDSGDPPQLSGREDIRDRLIITIDPHDARDFDDAISLERNKEGQWELGVHIADVSQFVTPGSKLDDEAYQRATSVYLPQHVLPMLPELLSNGICSLQEGRDRFVKSAYIRFDDDGQVRHTRFANSLIRSTRRLTYEDADAILDGRTEGFQPNIIRFVKLMEQAARVLEARRRRDGMMELDLPKAELIYDDQGHVVDARPESRTFSHTIIEMFMLEANEAVARLLDRLEVPFLRRIHPEPDGLALGDAARVLKLCGYVIPKNMDRFGLQALLRSVQDTPQSFVVNLAVLKSLQRAEYSPAPVGHYALASENYCHFTSPIRRYPDLTIHRLVQLYLEGTLKKKKPAGAPDFDALVESGRHCSSRERNAENAENELRSIKILQMLEKRHMGDTFAGVITSVTNFGMFVQLDKYLIEGLIRADDIPLKTRTGKHKGKRKNRQKTTVARKGKFIDNCPYHLGQVLSVRIAKINVPARTLDLVLV